MLSAILPAPMNPNMYVSIGIRIGTETTPAAMAAAPSLSLCIGHIGTFSLGRRRIPIAFIPVQWRPEIMAVILAGCGL
ncbi:hypothetical protein RHGRI_006474 [Rhododendron griersonianum]|uniref:Uncharacterized protein n=1 Tax=Rhododendron griersonianum TaxID=479676 RepID=A0AAV6KUR1_9ERIC|nr:hypothetical protein RHGRI_006474 [Rhododendron griersonianum]